jgi:hypothetical protein
LGVDWFSLAEAPDFSVPDAGNIFPDRDPLDPNRAIRPGELFFMTPLYVRNKSIIDCWIEVRLMLENGITIECPGLVIVPAGDTALIPIQGRSIINRNYLSLAGDRLQVRAQIANALDLWATAEEKPSAEHIGVI